MADVLKASSTPPTLAFLTDPIPRLPLELLLLVFDHLPSDLATLRWTCLVSKQWLSISQPRLFDHIYLSAPKTDRQNPSCSALYQVLCESPHLVQYIRHITILGGALWTTTTVITFRWLPSDECLPALLDILSNSKVESFHMRLSNETWFELPEALQASIRSLISSPYMRDVDLTGFDIVDAPLFKHCYGLKRLKFSEIGELHVGKESDTDGASSATCESLTLLDTVDVPKITSWAISAPIFRALRDVRLGFHPLDVPHVQGLLRHVGSTLESLHLQPVYAHWLLPESRIHIGSLPILTSLRLSLGISEASDPVPWAIFLLSTLEHNDLQHLTIDLRVDRDRIILHPLPWKELDSALGEPQLATLRALVFTCYPYKSRRESWNEAAHETVKWLVEELPRLLPRAREFAAFDVHELSGSLLCFFCD
ncbi:hypothetical protein B0H19DRAFT_1252469 [Mycena capillaripes]|nr:hypothetical protein B0H19DRAFT_1252469 [Mycena capillaripes]